MGHTPNVQHWGTPPNAQQWGPPPNAQQWGTPPTTQQWGTPPTAHQWGTPPNAHQWGSSSSVPQWGTPPNTQQQNPPTNVQRGFSTIGQVEVARESEAFRICQLRSHGLQNLNYEERIELWNLENEQFEELIIQPSISYYNQYFERGPIQTGCGLGWRNIWCRLQEDDAACLQLLRMSIGAFRTLCDKLQTSYGLQPTLNVGIEESVAMFLRICGHNEVQRDVGLRFGRTQETVNRKFFEVLKATELLACDYIRTPTTQELRQIPERLVMDPTYWPYFSGFVGAMDGVHVCVKVKPEVQGMYWDRHNITSFNIMAICDLNMLFTYVWNGAPGSCHDTAVLTMAQERDPDFPLPPPDKYYLVDSGYPNKQGLLGYGRRSGGFFVNFLDMI
ncbi:unnamed protein product [Microthlaspi erraticum]|uniref:Uncharacterized protein n=1 Tax=Microthlaspi erraticum TaxID=1685480 RepID=A0A6D2KSZ6_9BRAS|nr:unnamed protein product [Microthlaspi erraticum]